MTNQPDPDPGVETPPPYPPDPSATPEAPDAPATVVDGAAATPSTAPPPPMSAAPPPPAPSTVAPFPPAGAPAAATAAYATPTTPASQPPKSSAGRTLPWILAGVFAVAAIGLGIWAFSLKSDLDERDDAIETLLSDNVELDSQLSALQEGQESAQQELDEATAAADSLAEELETAQSDLATAQSDLETRTSELDDANAQIADLEAQLEAATATTLPPETTAPVSSDPQEDGVITADEFAIVTQALGATVPAGFTVEQAQGIVDEACAATDTDALTNVVLDVQATYFPGGTTFDAGTLTGGVSAAACFSHIQSLTGA